MTSKNFKITKTEGLPNSEAQITGEITLPFLHTCKPEALKHLNQHANIPGFRAGHIPEDVLVKKYGEMAVWEEVAEVALAKEYAHIIEESKVKAIGRPQISITKLVPNTPLEFKIKVAVEPEFNLPDYKKIVKEIVAEKIEVEVTDKEVEEVVQELEKRKIKPELKEGENLNEKVRENLVLEKEQFAREKKRLKIIESLVKETKIDVPEVLINSELGRMLAQFKEDITRVGMQWADYLKEIKKTEEEIKNEWKDKAIERVKAELIISHISHKEKIEPAESELEAEAKHLLSHYPDADPLRARIYIYTQLRNQKVFEFLESL